MDYYYHRGYEPIPGPTNKKGRKWAIALVVAFAIALLSLLFATCRSPGEAGYNYDAAVVLQAQGHHQQAAEMYSKAIFAFAWSNGDDPRLVYAYVNRAFANWHLGAIAISGPDIARAVELDPELAKRYIRRSVIYTSAARSTGVVKMQSAAASTEPAASPFYNSQGVNLLHLGQPARSMVNLNHAIELDAGNALAWSNRAALRLILGEPAKALEDVDEAIRLRSTVAKMHANRALIKTALGMDEAAERDLTTAVALGLDPTRLRVGISMLKQIR